MRPLFASAGWQIFSSKLSARHLLSFSKGSKQTGTGVSQNSEKGKEGLNGIHVQKTIVRRTEWDPDVVGADDIPEMGRLG